MSISIERVTPGDSQLEREGVWTPYLDKRLKISRGKDLMDQHARVRELSREWAADNPSANVTDEISKGFVIQWMAEEILVDYEGVKGRDDAGNLVDAPYTIQYAIDLLTVDVDLRRFVLEFSIMPSNYVRKDAEEMSGNSHVRSIGA